MLNVPKQYPENVPFVLNSPQNNSAIPVMYRCLGTPLHTTSHLYICSVRTKILLPLNDSASRFVAECGPVTTVLLTVHLAVGSGIRKQNPASSNMAANTQTALVEAVPTFLLLFQAFRSSLSHLPDLVKDKAIIQRLRIHCTSVSIFPAMQ